MQITLPQSNDYALDLKFEYRPGWEQWVFLSSDIHADSPECLDDLLTEHLELAKERNAIWIDNGDLPDVINSAGDKRGHIGGMREVHNRADYLDAIVSDLANRFDPYADMLVYLGRGNHDAKIIKVHNTDILRRFAEELSRRRSERKSDMPPIHVAGYGGWIKLSFEHPSGGRYQSINMKMFHGVGGGGEVTKGAMEAQRMMATVSNADIVVTGHIHEKWEMELVREELGINGRIRLKPRTHLKLGSYKMDFRVDGAPTWHMMRPGGTPKPVGGSFLRLFCDKMDRGVEWEVRKAPVNYRDLR